jgi:hypothetical protein
MNRREFMTLFSGTATAPPLARCYSSASADFLATLLSEA